MTKLAVSNLYDNSANC